MNNIKKWYTTTEWVDIETGEIIPKNKIKEYYKIKTTFKYKIDENSGTREYTNECRPIRQTRIEFGTTRSDNY